MTVFAHGLVGRADLPIPEELFGLAAAVVLVISFVALAAGWSTPRLQAVRERPLVPAPLALDVVAGIVGVAFFFVVVWAGLTGTDISAQNLAPSSIYILFWFGVPVLSLVFGDVFRLLSPWRAVGRAFGTLMRRFGGDEVTEPLPYPERIGYWPAAAGLFAFAVVELVWGKGEDPQTLAILALAYFVVQIAGMGLYGVEPWTRRADAFGVYFGLFGALAPLARRAGRLVLRAPGAGATQIERRPGLVGLMCVAIGATTFDGLREGPVFQEMSSSMQRTFVDAGLSLGTALEVAFLIGLLLSVGLVALVFMIGVGGMPRREDLRGRFVHSLIPIAAAYIVAHYFSSLAYEGQALYALASDPLGDGSDFFGTAGYKTDYGVISATGIWYVQLAALVIGHVTGLVLAHDRALVVYGSHGEANRSQVAMLFVMISFTCLGLWLLSTSNG